MYKNSVVVVVALALLGGCGESESAAFSKIEAESAIVQHVIQTGRGSGFLWHTAPLRLGLNRDSAELNWLQAEGYLNWSTKPGLFGMRDIVAKPTEKGAKIFRSFRTDDQIVYVDVKVATVQPLVMNILTDSKSGTATADYTVKLTPAEPLYSRFCGGDRLRTTYECNLSAAASARAGKATFKKYDQGWRVELL
jgi:hypothetical protein